MGGFGQRLREAADYARIGGSQREAIGAALAPGEQVAYIEKASDGRVIAVTDRRLLVAGGLVAQSRVLSYPFGQIASVSVSPRLRTAKVQIELPLENGRDFFIFTKASGIALGNDLAQKVGV